MGLGLLLLGGVRYILIRIWSGGSLGFGYIDILLLFFFKLQTGEKI